MTFLVTGGQITVTGGRMVYNDTVITLTDQNLSDFALIGAAAAYYFVTSGGVIERSFDIGGVGPLFLETWCTPTNQAANYEVRATVTSGALTGGSGTGTWLPISGGTRNWYVENFTSGTIESCTFTVEIRQTGTSTVIDSATITLTAEVS